MIEDCEISCAGRVNPEACGVVLANVSDSSVTHCDIHDLYYTGVSVGWTWGYGGSFAQRNTIAFNRIYDIGKHVMADMGGVYTLGTSFGTCVSNNVIHSIDSISYGGWGLYNDEGSEGIVMENNLVYDTTDASYHQHYGRNNVVRNNIFVGARKCQLAVTRPEPHLSVTFERNIVAWDYDGPAYREPMWMRGLVDGTARVNWTNNLFWCLSGPTVVNAPHPVIAADPCFVDAARHKYQLENDSPAFRFGFSMWDVSKSGRRGPAEFQHDLPSLWLGTRRGGRQAPRIAH
ncbi:MAG: right-handed parallel beta-helix repeat-containing protein [Kiritimatiellae bacterium]|nr:right-handed parallel beta-helix repeat-containing protein [Kiritimatiellia bacterium]